MELDLWQQGAEQRWEPWGGKEKKNPVCQEAEGEAMSIPSPLPCPVPKCHSLLCRCLGHGAAGHDFDGQEQRAGEFMHGIKQDALVSN